MLGPLHTRFPGQGRGLAGRAPWADADLVGQAEGDVAAAAPGGEGGDINDVVTNGGAAGFATALASGPRGHYTIPGQSIGPEV